GDGDVATASTDIGSQIHFHDDGPTAAISPTETSVNVDETAGTQPDETTAAGVIALFAGVANPGTDASPSPAQYATKGGLVSTAGSSAGADQEGATTVLSLAINGGDHTDSGLTTTDGHAIFLFKEGSLIVGRYDGADAGTDVTNTGTDPAAFAIAIDPT